MPGIGPRVGGAHVDVNLKFDDKSINAVGSKIHRQLSSLTKSINDHLVSISKHNRDVYRGIGQAAVTAWRAALGATLVAAPHIGSLMSALAGTATNLAGALYSVGQASGAMLPIFTSLGLAGLTLSIGMRNFGAAVSEVDPKRLQLLLKGMPASMQAAVLSTRKLSNEMRVAVWPKLFAGLNEGIDGLRETGVIQRGLGAMATSLNGLAKSVLAYANTKEGVKTLNSFFQNNAQVFAALSKAVVPFLDGFLRLINALTPSAIRFAGTITSIGEKFQSWAKGADFAARIDESMKKAQNTSGLFFKVLGNLGRAIMNVFNAANPATNTFLQMLVGVTAKFEKFTGSVKGQKSIAEWAMSSVDVMRQFGHTIEAIFKVIAELADPRVITSFLKTLENAFNILGKLPLDKIVSDFVSLAEALQPISGPILAFIIAGTAFNILIGNMIGQMAGFFGIMAGAKGAGAAMGGLFKGLGGGGKHVKDVGLLSKAFNGLKTAVSGDGFASAGKHVAEIGKHAAGSGSKTAKLLTTFEGLGSVLSKGLKFAGFAGIAIWIALLIAKSKDLQKKLGTAFKALGGIFGSLGGAFKEIGTALGPVFKALKPVFDLMDKLATLAIGVFLDTIITGFKGFANVIKGAGSIIAGIINILVGLFTLDFSKMFDGLKQVFAGIGPLLQGGFQIFISFFAPAKFAKFGLGLVKGLGGGLLRAMPEVLGFLARFVVNIVGFFITLPFKLVGLGARAISALAQAIGRAAPGVLAAASRIVSGVIGWIVRLPGRLLSLGGQAISSLAGAVSRGIPALIGSIRRMVSDAVSLIKTLPSKIVSALGDLGGLLKDSGVALMKGFAKGITAGLGNVKDAIKGVLGKARDLLPFSPAKEGPFSGRGYTTFSGAALMTDFGKGMESATDNVRSSLNRSLSRVSVGSGLSPSAATSPLASQTSQAPSTSAGETAIEIHQNYYGPTTSGGRLRELDWTLRYATKARTHTVAGVAT